MKGLVGHGAPVLRLSRSVLPPRDSRFSGLVPTAAYPVPTTIEPSRAISSRQPPCRPLLVGKPPTSALIRRALVAASFRRQATTCTWCPPPRVWPPWQV